MMTHTVAAVGREAHFKEIVRLTEQCGRSVPRPSPSGRTRLSRRPHGPWREGVRREVVSYVWDVDFELTGPARGPEQ
ncbi:hypothetical protein [Streptomyces sp. NPDC090798]|uniref:hypothetical protein n=1 Tax=Streptomyces sp. NPDC090798 TaxID=3365968 RepID=UPI0038046798